jgi:hypothetical protein
MRCIIAEAKRQRGEGNVQQCSMRAPCGCGPPRGPASPVGISGAAEAPQAHARRALLAKHPAVRTERAPDIPTEEGKEKEEREKFSRNSEGLRYSVRADTFRRNVV